MKKHVFAGFIVLILTCLVGCSHLGIGSATKKPDKFSLGDLIVIANDYEITLINSAFTQKVTPTDPSTFYSTFEVTNPENTFFHATFEIKNLRGSEESADEIMTVNMLYDKQAGYLCSSAVERNGDFFLSGDTMIMPLSTETVHYLAEIPRHIANRDNSISIQIVVMNHTMTYSGNDTVGKEIIFVDLGSTLEENTEWQTYEQIVLDQPITEEGFGNLTLTKTLFTGSVEPANRGSLYAANGTTNSDRIYLDTVFNFVNMATGTVEAKELLEAKIIYDNKYEYGSFMLIEHGRNTDLLDAVMVTINPQATETLHYVFELPPELENSSRPLVLTLSYNSTDYYYRIR